MITSVKRERVLEPGLNQLHEESREWQRNIDFLKVESTFLQKVLEQNALKAKDVRHQKELEQIQNLLTYYRGEVLDEMKHDLRAHEHQLAQMLTTGETKLNEGPYRFQHEVLSDRLSSFHKEYDSWKGKLFHFVESLG